MQSSKYFFYPEKITFQINAEKKCIGFVFQSASLAQSDAHLTANGDQGGRGFDQATFFRVD